MKQAGSPDGEFSSAPLPPPRLRAVTAQTKLAKAGGGRWCLRPHSRLLKDSQLQHQLSSSLQMTQGCQVDPNSCAPSAAPGVPSVIPAVAQALCLGAAMHPTHGHPESSGLSLTVLCACPLSPLLQPCLCPYPPPQLPCRPPKKAL